MRMGVASPSNYFWLRSSSALDFKRVGSSEEMATINDLPDVSNRHTKTSENVDHDGRQNYGASYELHRAAFHGDLARVEELLTAKLDLSTQDKHGNTPLHIAVMLGHRAIIDELLKHGAQVREKNRLGWTPLDEAISYGNKATIAVLLKKLRKQTTEALIKRRQELVRTLQNLDDFYAELKWEFQTWVPFLSRLLPSDVCKIYKSGSCVRLDTTLGDFTEMRWQRGDLSFIFNGENNDTPHTLSMVLLDNQVKEYQRLRLLGTENVETDLTEHVNLLRSKPIVYANMSTRPITVTRAQSGWFFRVDRTERVGEYDTDVYNITNLILIARRRREHLTPEQIQQYEELARRVERGEINEEDLCLEEEEQAEEEKVEREEEGVSSLPPPSHPDLTWEEYINAPAEEPPHLGRTMDLKVERKHYRASVCMAEECPIEMKKLLDILEVIAPYKHFNKLREFVSLKLPHGFPVKVDVPVFPTVTAVVTLQRYSRREHPISTFLIPRDYKKYDPKEKKKDSATNAVATTSS